MEAEGVDPAAGGLRVSVQPGGCSGFKYGLLIEDQARRGRPGPRAGAASRSSSIPFSAQYLSGVIIDYVSSMQGSGFTSRIRMRPAAAAAAAPSPPDTAPLHDTHRSPGAHCGRRRRDSEARDRSASRGPSRVPVRAHGAHRANASAPSSSRTTSDIARARRRSASRRSSASARPPASGRCSGSRPARRRSACTAS